MFQPTHQISQGSLSKTALPIPSTVFFVSFIPIWFLYMDDAPGEQNKPRGLFLTEVLKKMDGRFARKSVHAPHSQNPIHVVCPLLPTRNMPGKHCHQELYITSWSFVIQSVNGVWTTEISWKILYQEQQLFLMLFPLLQRVSNPCFMLSTVGSFGNVLYVDFSNKTATSCAPCSQVLVSLHVNEILLFSKVLHTKAQNYAQRRKQAKVTLTNTVWLKRTCLIT